MIVWNRVTWYSRYLALFFFTLVFPLWTFYLGTQYEKAVNTDNSQIVLVPLKENNKSTTTVPTETKIDSGIKGEVKIGPTCPVESTPPDPKCADKPYSPTLVFRNLESNETKIVKVSTSGQFKVDLKPGIYKIENQSTSILPRMEDVENIVVEKGVYSEVSITFDSGIR